MLLYNLFTVKDKSEPQGSCIKAQNVKCECFTIIIWLPVKTQLYYRDAALSFKCMTGRVPDYLSVQFVKREKVSGRKTRGSQMLHIPLFNLLRVKKLFNIEL